MGGGQTGTGRCGRQGSKEGGGRTVPVGRRKSELSWTSKSKNIGLLVGHVSGY